ncbi:MAG: site-specific integrase, partial [Bacteroidales bacterium]|nr:site-specific integrase [Bacteroidales bacterium]
MSVLNKIKSYTIPELHKGKENYIAFYAFDPLTGKLKRKKIKVNFVKGSSAQKKKYISDLIKRLTAKLESGWNPWIEGENASAYRLFGDIVTLYKNYITKMFRDDVYREDTYVGYLSYCNNMVDYNNVRKPPITYIYQFDKEFCVRFLEEVYVGRDNAAITRDNYLTFLKSFAKFCCQRLYLQNDPTAGMERLGKRFYKKQRTQISVPDLVRITDYLEKNNKRHFLLACYILYYCFIRPKEMSKLKLANFNLKEQSVYLQGDITKNRCDGVITLPAKVINLMIDLRVFDNQNDYFLFSDEFKPGQTERSEKQFRDFWSTHVRKDLRLKDSAKFYSLKDTGITNMLRSFDTLSVRDQARHSSILMTDIYTP